MKIDFENRTDALFITIKTAGQPFNNRPTRYASSYDSEFVVDLLNISANASLRGTLGRNWHKQRPDTAWIGYTEYKNKSGNKHTYLHVHTLMFGDKLPLLIEKQFFTTFENALGHFHQKQTMLRTQQVDIRYVPFSDLQPVGNYILKNVDHSPRARKFQRVF